MVGNNDFFQIFERNKYLKKIPSMQRVKNKDNTVKLTYNGDKVLIITQ